MGKPGYSTPAYTYAKRTLAGQPCWRCGQPSTTVDHVPPLRTAPHWTLWRGELKPACKRCNYSDGARYRNGRATKTNPSRAW